MTKVYRVESMTGRGPYGVSGETHSELYGNGMYRHHSDHDHPSPEEDGIYAWEDHHVCGFDSLRKLSNWFQGYETDLERLGYKVSEYDTDEEVFVGDRQVMFDRDKSIFVRRYGLDRVKEKL